MSAVAQGHKIVSMKSVLGGLVHLEEYEVGCCTKNTTFQCSETLTE